MSFDWLQTAITLLPIAALVWKAALMAAEIKELRKDVNHNHDKIDKLAGKVEEERVATDSAMSTVLNSLHKIELTVTEIKTKMEAKGL